MAKVPGKPVVVGVQDPSPNESGGEQWANTIRSHGGQINCLQGEVRDWISKMAKIESNIASLQLNLAEVKQENDNLGSKFFELDQKYGEKHEDMVKRLKVNSEVLYAKFERSKKEFADSSKDRLNT